LPLWTSLQNEETLFCHQDSNIKAYKAAQYDTYLKQITQDAMLSQGEPRDPL